MGQCWVSGTRRTCDEAYGTQWAPARRQHLWDEVSGSRGERKEDAHRHVEKAEDDEVCQGNSACKRRLENDVLGQLRITARNTP